MGPLGMDDGAFPVMKVAGAVVLAVLVSGALLASTAGASNVLTLRSKEPKQPQLVIEPGEPVQAELYILSLECGLTYSGTLETNQAGTDKLGFSALAGKNCSREKEGYLVTGGKLKSITATASGVMTFLFSPALNVQVPGPCHYSFSKTSASFPLPSLVGPNGSLKGKLIQTEKTASCPPEWTLDFESFGLFRGSPIYAETQLSSYKAEAPVELEATDCGANLGRPVIGTAKFTRSTTTNVVTVTYKVKGTHPNTVFFVTLDAAPCGLNQLLLVNKTTKASTFTTNAKGEGSFTGSTAVPANFTEFWVEGEAERSIFYPFDSSLTVSLP
jgi:hypothetical protein